MNMLEFGTLCESVTQNYGGDVNIVISPKMLKEIGRTSRVESSGHDFYYLTESGLTARVFVSELMEPGEYWVRARRGRFKK